MSTDNATPWIHPASHMAGDGWHDVSVEMFHMPDDHKRIDLLWWQERGLSYTASGYGGKIPTRHKIKINGRWRRVYCMVYSNSGTCYVVVNGRKMLVTD